MSKETGFSAADKEERINYFLSSPENKRLLERLNETRNRLPWTQKIVDSLKSRIEHSGELSDKQRSLATKLYLDCCITTDEKLIEQVETRKTCLRLLGMELGKTADFIYNMVYHSDTRPFTVNQIRAVNNIAKRHRKALEEAPPLTDFDGWFPKT
jgi:hypothetical protein